MTPSSVLLDTGPLVGLITARDQGHERAKAAFARLSEEKRNAYLPYPVAIELHRFLLYQKPQRIEAAINTLRALLRAFPLVMPLSEDIEAGLEQMAQYPDQKISLVDATLAQMALREGVPVVTFDNRHFRLLGVEVYEVA